MNLSLSPGEALLTTRSGDSVHYSLLYSGMLYRIATLSFDRCKSFENQHDAISSIIFAAASLEAYLNELSEVCDAYGQAANDETLKTMASILKDAEESRLPTTTKCTLAKKFLTGCNYDRGANPYQDFSLLIDLRNILIHSRPRGRGISEPSNQDQKILRNLVIRGLCEEPMNDNFLKNIATLKVAHFCCNAGSNMIQDLANSYNFPQDCNVGILSVVGEIPDETLTRIQSMYPNVHLLARPAIPEAGPPADSHPASPPPQLQGQRGENEEVGGQ